MARPNGILPVKNGLSELIPASLNCKKMACPNEVLPV